MTKIAGAAIFAGVARSYSKKGRGIGRCGGAGCRFPIMFIW
ncbi:MAG: hypothetical protein M0Z56_07565 [Desulfobacteraceae bacterium]|nr:hypothetical protein [Desulfobacteraceae bacterium]